MVYFTGLEQKTSGILSSAHNYIKNIETAHLGKLYTTVIDNLDYYVIECVAKPALNSAPEWVTDNRVVNSIKNNKDLAIVIAGTLTVALLVYFVVMLHPKTKNVPVPEKTPEPPKEPDQPIREADKNGGAAPGEKLNPPQPINGSDKDPKVAKPEKINGGENPAGAPPSLPPEEDDGSGVRTNLPITEVKKKPAAESLGDSDNLKSIPATPPPSGASPTPAPAAAASSAPVIAPTTPADGLDSNMTSMLDEAKNLLNEAFDDLEKKKS